MKNRKILFSLIIFVFILLFITKIYFTRPSVPILFERDHLQYGIMFDAGSTGSRIHVFRFMKSIEDNQKLKLNDSLFERTEPGLSSYANNPEKGSESLRTMLEKAKKYIPETHWSTTPLALKATAGLRLLDRKKSDSIIAKVKELFQSYPFKFNDENVSILDGSEEGLFSWFTINYLSSNEETLDNPEKTYGVIDLGGGSTQITFLLNNNTVDKIKPEYKTRAKIFNEEHTMYTYSYLGLGIMSFRHQLLGGSEDNKKSLSHICLPNNYTGHWVYQNTNYTIKSQYIDNEKRFQLCSSLIKDLVLKHSMATVGVASSNNKFFAISFFYDLAMVEKLIGKNGGTISIDSLVKTAEKACALGKKDDPFKCADLTYLSSLLINGYGFPQDRTFKVTNRIDCYELAWPLGAIMQIFGLFGKL